MTPAVETVKLLNVIAEEAPLPARTRDVFVFPDWPTVIVFADPAAFVSILIVWAVVPEDAPIVIVFARSDVPIFNAPAVPPVPTSKVTAPEVRDPVTTAPEIILIAPVAPEVVVVPVLRFKIPELPDVELPVITSIAPDAPFDATPELTAIFPVAVEPAVLITRAEVVVSPD